MSLWGTKDTVYSTGNVNVNVTTGVVTRQSGTINWSSIEVGQVITIDGTHEGIIESIDVATGNSAQLTIGTEYLPSANISNKTYEIREIPKSTLHDTNYAVGEIFGVDTTEIGVANGASGNARKFAPPHSGWVGITSYTDMHGNLRVKTEVLVANSTISGDSTDDTILPDS
tara:strand:- start:111 stop:623 length:513 start_codon:yes stop_codon:yes gene_type:complete